MFETGRKPVLFSVIIIFLIGSALCGAAQNMTWLIVCRAIQGIGGGGILQLVQITISDIVSLEECVCLFFQNFFLGAETRPHFYCYDTLVPLINVCHVDVENTEASSALRGE